MMLHKKIKMTVGALALCFMGLLCGCTAEKGFVVSITDGKMSYELEEPKACKVKDVFDEAGITIAEGDEVSMNLSNSLNKDTKITINRLVDVTINYDGKDYDISLCGASVKDAIKEAKVPIPNEKYVSCDLNAPLEDGMKIKVNKVQVKTEKVEKPIKFKSIEEETEELVRGETNVKQEGADGVKTTTFKVTYVDGKEVKRKKTKSKVTQEPVDEIILVGTAEPEPEPEVEEESESESEGNDESDDEEPEESEPTIVSQENFDDCDGSGHGYTIITYSDGSTEQQEY